MRMDRAGAAGPLIRAMGPSGFRVDENVYTALTLTPTRADAWSPPPLAQLDESALAAILEGAPEFVLLGTGANLARPPRALVAALEARGIGVEAMDSRAAARAWGVLRAEDRQVVAALYPIDA
ncbi:Uncharacterized conserved protein, contains Mth938-like domain [Sphingomonas palmae]|uniref:Uncharacterized conserved protein, contains Mth938-like domain n=1 Tax=Sphingomonas palmae TaxID=1855283 RepID=A0A1H7NQX6_9SPHN|nr:Mth938-like domain-containing protein [Sphingomonas palmae]SEL25970.1 Uncharacterized conserved protein, contains Mth938-like domain [Sphingomonas palmae]